jgi:hypothetical protein
VCNGVSYGIRARMFTTVPEKRTGHTAHSFMLNEQMWAVYLGRLQTILKNEIRYYGRVT